MRLVAARAAAAAVKAEVAQAGASARHLAVAAVAEVAARETAAAMVTAGVAQVGAGRMWSQQGAAEAAEAAAGHEQVAGGEEVAAEDLGMELGETGAVDLEAQGAAEVKVVAVLVAGSAAAMATRVVTETAEEAVWGSKH